VGVSSTVGPGIKIDPNRIKAVEEV
jgi:hypothetical protein